MVTATFAFIFVLILYIDPNKSTLHVRLQKNRLCHPVCRISTKWIFLFSKTRILSLAVWCQASSEHENVANFSKI